MKIQEKLKILWVSKLISVDPSENSEIYLRPRRQASVRWNVFWRLIVDDKTFGTYIKIQLKLFDLDNQQLLLLIDLNGWLGCLLRF